MSRYDLTDFEWRVIAPLLPNEPRGVPRVDDRRVLNGIFWVLRSGARWRDLPERFGPRTTCYNPLRAVAEGGCMGSDDGRHHRRTPRRHPDDRQHFGWLCQDNRWLGSEATGRLARWLKSRTAAIASRRVAH